MKLSDLSVESLAKIKTVRFDQIVEKHEGPERWESYFRFYDLDFIEVEGQPVLLPVDRKQHSNITIRRTIFSTDGQTLTLFLTDTTYFSGDELIFAGYLAVCDKLPGEEFFLAIVYHEWFATEYYEGFL